MDEFVVTIPRRLYEDLLADSLWLECLEEAGVDNWDGFEHAYELFSEKRMKKDE